MFLCLNSKNVIYSLLIITIQLTIILSNEEKCYSIESCLRCPELDLCEECETGFKLNKPKTKCIGKNMKEKKIDSSSSGSSSKSSGSNPSSSKKVNPNQIQSKQSISANKAPNNPFQNIPVSSLQRFKDKEANNEIINKILIFILIILVLSIIASVIYNFIKKKLNKGYTEDDGQEENAKVVYIR